MTLPFSSDEFFGVLAAYNRATWPFVIVLWLASAATVAAVAWRSGKGSRVLSYVLSGLWLWNAVAYHAFFFTRINPAAWLFAGLFAFEAAWFYRAGRQDLRFFRGTGASRAAGLALVGFGLAYPVLALSVGHPYPFTPTFGVPCPTTILTIGLLLTTERGPSFGGAVVPAIWGLIGGSAALLLGVWPDYVLLAAGVGLLILLTRGWLSRATDARRAELARVGRH